MESLLSLNSRVGFFNTPKLNLFLVDVGGGGSVSIQLACVVGGWGGVGWGWESWDGGK